MNKIILVCVYALVAYTAAQNAPANPLAGIMGMLKNFDLTKQCLPVCQGTCKASTAVCISVPNLVNCEQNDKACNSICTDVCNCLSGCEGECATLNPCAAPAADANPLSQLFQPCKMKQAACKIICQGNCPNQSIIKVMQATSQRLFGMLAAFLPQKPAA